MGVTRIWSSGVLLNGIWLASLAGVAPQAHADGLTRVEQTIFGMDCAPCAYGIEQGLKKLPGVTAVRVSLNEGRAEVTLAADSPATLENMRRIVRDNGFTPKAARVTLTGTFQRADDGEWLAATGLPRYRLIAGDETVAAALRAQAHGSGVQVEGEIPEAVAAASELTVTRLRSQ